MLLLRKDTHDFCFLERSPVLARATHILSLTNANPQKKTKYISPVRGPDEEKCQAALSNPMRLAPNAINNYHLGMVYIYILAIYIPFIYPMILGMVYSIGFPTSLRFLSSLAEAS